MPTRNRNASSDPNLERAVILPSVSPSLESLRGSTIIDEISDSDDDCCRNCGESFDGGDEFSIQNGDEEQYWCQSCYENESFHCNSCGVDFSQRSHEHFSLDDDCVVCESCFEENTHECARCNDRLMDRDLISGIIANPVEAVRHYTENGDQDTHHLPSVSMCRECKNELVFVSACSGLRFAIVSANDKIPIVNYPNLFVHRVEIDLMPQHFRPAPGGVELRRSPHPNALESTHPSRPSFIRQRGSRSYSSMFSHLKEKVLQDLANRPSSFAPPVHDRVYIGMEFEAQAGRFIIDQPLRLLNKELGCPYKSCPDKKTGGQCTHGVRIVRDGSIRGEGWEFLPPIIKHKKGWEQVEKMVKSLKDFGWSADSSCGIHFHLSHGMLNPDHPDIIRNIFRMFFYLEPLIFNCLPIERRNNKYCYPISKYFTAEDLKQDLKLDFWYYNNFWKKQITRSDGNRREQHYRFNERGEAIEAIPFGHGPYMKRHMDQDKREHYYVGRYIGCNLHPLFTKGTIEFRYFPAYLDFDYIKNWAEIISRMVKAGIDGIDIKVIEDLSASRGNMDKAIKDMAKVFKFSTPLTNFLKLEYRKYRKQPEFVPTPKSVPIALREIHTNFTALEENAQFGYRLIHKRDQIWQAEAYAEAGTLNIVVNDEPRIMTNFRAWFILKILTDRITSLDDSGMRNLLSRNRDQLTRLGIGMDAAEGYLHAKLRGNTPSMSAATVANVTAADPALINLQFDRTPYVHSGSDSDPFAPSLYNVEYGRIAS